MPAFPRDDDGRVVSGVIVAGFFLLALTRIGIPSAPYFDENYYVPAAARLALGSDVANREHPMLAKELMAVFLILFGDTPLGWRIGSAIGTSVSLLAFSRAVWWLGRSRVSVIVFTALAATNFLLFGLAGMALLDPYMLAFVGLAAASIAHGVRNTATASVALAGISIGLAMACKWTAAPVWLLIGALFAWRWRRSPRQLLVGAGLLGLLPMATYLITYLPGVMVDKAPLRIGEIWQLHQAMFQRLGLLVRNTAYSSRWWQWPLGEGPMWLVRGQQDGAYRVLVLGINPVFAVLTVVALPYALWRFVRRGDWVLGLPVVGFLVTLLFWAVGAKPVQFIYHYATAAMFAAAAIALVLGRVWESGRRSIVAAAVAAAALSFGWFYPVLSASPLGGAVAEYRYAWWPGWHPGPWKKYPITPEDQAKLEHATRCLESPATCRY